MPLDNPTRKFFAETADYEDVKGNPAVGLYKPKTSGNYGGTISHQTARSRPDLGEETFILIERIFQNATNSHSGTYFQTIDSLAYY